MESVISQVITTTEIRQSTELKQHYQKIKKTFLSLLDELEYPLLRNPTLIGNFKSYHHTFDRIAEKIIKLHAHKLNQNVTFLETYPIEKAQRYKIRTPILQIKILN